MTMDKADSILQQVFSWEAGQEIEVILIRKGEEVEIKAKTVQSYTNGEILQANPNATKAQIEIREAWLKAS